LELIQKMVVDAYDLRASYDIFDLLTSMILDPMREDDEMKWIYFIANNQEKAIDADICRLINSFLYSRMGKKVQSAMLLR
jgi:hypothetical protein